MELAESLSAEDFVDCLRRLIARRGRPNIIYCDNGTNFTGTANAFNDLDWVKIEKSCTARKFNGILIHRQLLGGEGDGRGS